MSLCQDFTYLLYQSSLMIGKFVFSSVSGSIQILLWSGFGIFKFCVTISARQWKQMKEEKKLFTFISTRTMDIVPRYLYKYNENFSVLLILLSYKWLFEELEMLSGSCLHCLYPHCLAVSGQDAPWCLRIGYSQRPSCLNEAADFGKTNEHNSILMKDTFFFFFTLVLS